MNKPPKPEFYNLPPYLGLGRYHQAYRQKDVVRAGYWVDGEDYSAFYVRVEEDSCLFSESWERANFAHTWHINLEQAFLHHLVSIPPWQHPRFQWLSRRITSSRNIYLEYASTPAAVFYPGGFIFRLRQPVVDANRAALAKLQEQIAQLGESTSLRFESSNPGFLLKWAGTGRVNVEDIEVADFTVLLVDVGAATDLFWESGVVPEQKENRLEVVDVSATVQRSLSIRPGAPEHGFQTFAVVGSKDGLPALSVLKESFSAVSSTLAAKWQAKTN